LLTTDRLVLRRARMGDLADMHRVFADPRAMRYWDSLPHTDIEQTRPWLASMVAFDLGETDDFIVEHRSRAIGKAGCWRRGEIGFILHSDYWGQGFGREALGAAIPHVFASLPVDRLEADVDPRNAPALRLLAHFGFREFARAERTVRLGDEWCDSVYLELRRPA
jgi:RimJ/RimL family protein N-acetyltransferase